MCTLQLISSVRIQPAPKTLTPSFPLPAVAVRFPVFGKGRVYSPGSRVSTTRANALVPMVIESSPFGERAYDIFSRLMKERIICVNGPIDDVTASLVTAQLLFLESQSDSKPVQMYINSPGGSVTAGLAIYDTMQHINAPISTICTGQAASMGSLLLMAGATGQRMSLPHSTIMIHQPLYGYQGQAKNMMIHTKQLQRIWDMLNNIYVKHTGQELSVIEEYTDRDCFMTPQEAKEFGLIDEVIGKKPAGLQAVTADVVGLEQPRRPDSDPEDATAV